jgi:hypothetical protein
MRREESERDDERADTTVMAKNGTEVAAGEGTLWNRVARVFQDERSFWYLCAVLFGAVALLKGLRLPNSWAATQAQFGYDHGFVKRGLFGTVITRPLHLGVYQRFAVFSTALLGVLMAGLAAFTKWSGMNTRVAPMAATVVFFSSYTVTFLGYTNGYFDIPLAILAILLLVIPRPVPRLLAGLPLVTLALLTHEMFLLVFLPAVLLSFALNAAAETDRRRARLAIGCGILLAVFAGGLTLAIAKRPSLTPEEGRVAYTDIRQRVNFEPQHDFFRVLTRSAGDNMRLMGTFVRKISWWTDQAGGLVTVGPSVAMLLWLAYRMTESAAVAAKRWVFAACLVACFMPLAMNAMGFDVGRWWALTGLSTFLVFGAVCRYVPGPKLRLGVAMQRVALVIVALNLASGDGLIDPGSTIKAYPFTTEIKDSGKSLVRHWVRDF